MAVAALALLLCVCLAASEELLSWSGIEVTVEGRRVLRLRRGSANRRTLLAVLGPSGSGKTTFLNAIAGRVSGAVSDVVETASQHPLPQRDVAFVYQDDSFFPMLTVAETIALAYHLHHIASGAEAEARNATAGIFAVLQSLGLTEVAQSYVGDVNSRGISGGERKRLSLACELVGNPSLLVADEPTSGLDSFQSLTVVTLLRRLAADKNMAVVVSMHQPSSAIWALLDEVLLLTPGGRPAYMGRREHVLEHFRRLGHVCPPASNPAEFLLDLVSIDHSSPASSKRSRDRIDALVAAYALIEDGDENIDTAMVGRATAPPRPVVGVAGVLRRVRMLFVRAFRQTVRDSPTNLARTGTSVLLALLLSLVYGKQGHRIDVDSVGPRVNIIAMGAINIGMLAMIKTLQLFKRERGVIDRERRSRQYTAAEYLTSKFMAELPFDALTALSFGAVVHVCTELQQPLQGFLSVCGLLGLVASTLGMCVGAMCPAGDSALALGPALMVVYIIMGAIGPSGAGRPLPAPLASLRHLSPMRHACAALCAAEFRDVPLEVTNQQGGGFRRTLGFLVGKLLGRGPPAPPTGNDVLASLGLGGASYSASVRSLLKLLFGHMAVALLGLVIFKPK